jgi:hypothetical protein
MLSPVGCMADMSGQSSSFFALLCCFMLPGWRLGRVRVVAALPGMVGQPCQPISAVAAMNSVSCGKPLEPCISPHWLPLRRPWVCRDLSSREAVLWRNVTLEAEPRPPARHACSHGYILFLLYQKPLSVYRLQIAVMLVVRCVRRWIVLMTLPACRGDCDAQRHAFLSVSCKRSPQV